MDQFNHEQKLYEELKKLRWNDVDCKEDTIDVMFATRLFVTFAKDVDKIKKNFSFDMWVRYNPTDTNTVATFENIYYFGIQ